MYACSLSFYSNSFIIKSITCYSLIQSLITFTCTHTHIYIHSTARTHFFCRDVFFVCVYCSCCCRPRCSRLALTNCSQLISISFTQAITISHQRNASRVYFDALATFLPTFLLIISIFCDYFAGPMGIFK